MRNTYAPVVASPITLRIDAETRRRLARLARRNGMSTSAVIRDAIDAWVGRADHSGSPYDVVADLIGVVHGGNPSRSLDIGRRLTSQLRERRARS